MELDTSQRAVVVEDPGRFRADGHRVRGYPRHITNVWTSRGLWFLGYNGRTGSGPRTLSLFDQETGIDILRGLGPEGTSPQSFRITRA